MLASEDEFSTDGDKPTHTDGTSIRSSGTMLYITVLYHLLLPALLRSTPTLINFFPCLQPILVAAATC